MPGFVFGTTVGLQSQISNLPRPSPMPAVGGSSPTDPAFDITELDVANISLISQAPENFPWTRIADDFATGLGNWATGWGDAAGLISDGAGKMASPTAAAYRGSYYTPLSEDDLEAGIELDTIVPTVNDIIGLIYRATIAGGSTVPSGNWQGYNLEIQKTATSFQWQARIFKYNGSVTTNIIVPQLFIADSGSMIGVRAVGNMHVMFLNDGTNESILGIAYDPDYTSGWAGLEVFFSNTGFKLDNWIFNAYPFVGPNSTSDADSNGATTESVFVAISDSDVNSVVTELVKIGLSVADANSVITELASLAIAVSDVNGATTETPLVRVNVIDLNGTVTETPIIALQIADANGSTGETPLINILVTDANSASELGGLVAVLPALDGNSTSEVPLIGIAVADADSAVTEVGTAINRITVTDSNGSTTELALINILVSDVNGSSETTTLKAVLSASDVNGLNENAGVGILLGDQNGLSEVATLLAAIPAIDSSGTASELVSLLAAIFATDSSSSAEATILAAILQAIDSGTDAEAEALHALLTLSDANGATTESASVVVAIIVSDTNGTVTEQAVQGRFVTGTDTGSATETPTIVATLSISDVNGSLELGVLSVVLAGSDSGSGSENQAATRNFLGTDSGSGQDSATPTANLLDSEQPTISDLPDLAVVISAADVAAALEAAGYQQLLSASDSGGSSDFESLVAALQVTDLINAMDTATRVGFIVQILEAISTGHIAAPTTGAISDDVDTIRQESPRSGNISSPTGRIRN